MAEINAKEPQGVGGWLLVLSRLLIVWGPANFGLAAMRALPALPLRGWPLGAVLVARLLVTAFGIGAGMALASRRSSAVRLAQTALLLSAAMDLVVYTTPYFPNNRMPGDTPLHVAASLTYHGGWLMYLHRSRRVRNTYE